MSVGRHRRRAAARSTASRAGARSTRASRELLDDRRPASATAATAYPHEFSGGQRQRIGIARALAVQPGASSSPTSRCRRSTSRSRRRSSTCSPTLQQRASRSPTCSSRTTSRSSRHICRPRRGHVPRARSSSSRRPTRSTSTRCTRTRSRCSRRCRSPTRWSSSSASAILLHGDLPSPANPPTACRFHTRCPFVQPTKCRDDRPALRELRPGHAVACHWAEAIQAGEIKPHERTPVFDPARPGRTRADARLARLSRRRRRRAPRASARGTRGTVRRPSGCRSRAGEAPAG